MINVRLFVIALAILTTSCYSDSDYDSEPPYNPPHGDYRYESSSVYYDQNQNEVKRKNSETGGINFSSVGSTTMIITPLYGWSYSLEISNYAGHFLSDSSVAYTFSINVQTVIANNKDFNILGERSIELYDSDGTTLIGKFDGVIQSNTMEFGYNSIDVITGESTRTSITAVK